MILHGALLTVLSLVFPRAPAWALRLVGEGLPLAVDFVRQLTDRDLDGEDKALIVIDGLDDYLDKLDDLPEWEDLTERQRDRILTGLQELAYFLAKLPAKSRRDLRDDGDEEPGFFFLAPNPERAAKRRARRKKRREEKRASRAKAVRHFRKFHGRTVDIEETEE